jgi:four helix bundle protein
LIVWQKAVDLVLKVYEATDCFPQKEVFGLTNQLRRAAVSIPSNIAEGQGRNSNRDFLRYLSMARGSLQELETQLLIASRLGFLTDSYKDELVEIIADTGRLLNGLSRSLRDKDPGCLR